jgi:transposase InsO family protein
VADAQTPAQPRAGIIQAIVELRGELESEGHDAGAETIAYHLAQGHKKTPSVSAIWRILRREGLVVHEPKKRARSSWIRFCAELPNELWQVDVTCWSLASGQGVEILNQLDDHSPLFLGSEAYLRVKAADVVSSFQEAAELHGLPASLLSDNGAVFTGSYRGGKVLFEYELERLGVEFKNSRPYHPQTLGKVERLHQTLKRYLAKAAACQDAPTARGASSMPFATTTTTSARTGRSDGGRRCRPTAPA